MLKNTRYVMLFVFLSTYTILPQDFDPVKSFEKFIENYKDSFSTNERLEVAEFGGGWAKVKYTFFDVTSYDVVKSESLIRPFEGSFLFVLQKHMTNFHKTKELAFLDHSFSNKESILHDHSYSYTKDGWKEKKSLHHGGILNEWFECFQIIHLKNNETKFIYHGCQIR